MDQAGQIAVSEAELLETVVGIAAAAKADAIICVSESGVFGRLLHGRASGARVIVATMDGATHLALASDDIDAIRLPIRASDKHNQLRYALSVAFRAGRISVGDTVVCTIAPDVYPGEGNLVVATDVEASVENVVVSDLLKLTDGIQPRVLEAAIKIATHIGRAAQRGRRAGVLITLGDSKKVLEGARPLIPNPFHGHDPEVRNLTADGMSQVLLELAKLDGAFVVRGDGFIETAGVALVSPDTDMDLPNGLGTRHYAAAAVTKRTQATAVVTSATDGNVRAFSGGAIVLRLDPTVPHDSHVMSA